MSGVPGGLGLSLGGGQVVLGPRGVLLLAVSLRAAERLGRLDGARPTPDWAVLRDLMGRAAIEAAAAAGSADLPLSDSGSLSGCPPRIGLANPVGTAVAASLLGVSDRAIRDRCRRGVYATAVLQGRSWLIEVEEVQAAALGRVDDDQE